jgi:hypothetical protein
MQDYRFHRSGKFHHCPIITHMCKINIKSLYIQYIIIRKYIQINIYTKY